MLQASRLEQEVIAITFAARKTATLDPVPSSSVTSNLDPAFSSQVDQIPK